jgi:hypothetical protein
VRKRGIAPHTGDDRSPQRGGVLLRARADVHPEEAPPAHRERRMHPYHLAGAALGMGCIPRDAWHVDLAPDLAMVGRSPLGRALLQAVHRLESHRTNVGSPFSTDAPALPLPQPYDGVFGELTPGPQGPLSCRACSATCHTAQPFDVFVRSWP